MKSGQAFSPKLTHSLQIGQLHHLLAGAENGLQQVIKFCLGRNAFASRVIDWVYNQSLKRF